MKMEDVTKKFIADVKALDLEAGVERKEGWAEELADLINAYNQHCWNNRPAGQRVARLEKRVDELESNVLDHIEDTAWSAPVRPPDARRVKGFNDAGDDSAWLSPVRAPDAPPVGFDECPMCEGKGYVPTGDGPESCEVCDGAGIVDSSEVLDNAAERPPIQ